MDIQGENVHNFKEILLTMYVYYKAAFTFEVSFSTSKHYTLLSFLEHYPWFNLITITTKRNAFPKFCSIK